MPTSHPHQLNEIVELVVLTNPKSLLDIGIGNGKYGFLAREFLEIYAAQQDYGQRSHRIDGVEAYPRYVTDIHRAIYDSIFIGDALEVLPKLEIRYDLILLVDVLEHFTRDDGMAILDWCVRRARNVIVSTPLFVEGQEDSFSNPYEIHKSQWTAKDFGRFGTRFFLRNPLSLLCYFGESASRVAAARASAHRRALVKAYCPWLRGVYRQFRRILGGRSGPMRR